MAGSKLAELFIDITLRGGGKVQLVDMKKQLDAMKESAEAAERSLLKGGDLYQRQTKGTIDLLEKQAKAQQRLAEAQSKLAEMDLKTYGSKRYGEMLGAQKAAFDADKATKEKMAKAQAFRDQQSWWIAKGDGQKGWGAGMATGKAAGKVESAAEVESSALGIALKASSGMLAALGVSVSVGAGLRAAAGTTPNAAGLMSGSWQMLSNEIGMTLLPMLVEFSRALQGAAQWAKSLRESPLGKAVGSAAGGMFSAGGAIGAAGGMAAAGPIGAIIGAAAGGAIQNMLGGDKSPLLMSSNAQAGFSSIDEVWRKMQTEAATGGSLEAQILQQNIQANQQLMQIATNTGKPSSSPGNGV